MLMWGCWMLVWGVVNAVSWWWFVAPATTDEVLCGEVVTLALDLLMSCVLASLILVSLTRYQIC
jgi:hypothetical protein